jgi:hypothetical protein
MGESERDDAVRVEIERLDRLGHMKEFARGTAVVLGLGLLWVLEAGRNALFRLLDRMNVRARRHRRASAFPPGRPRRRRAA